MFKYFTGTCSQSMYYCVKKGGGGGLSGKNNIGHLTKNPINGKKTYKYTYLIKRGNY